MGDSGAQLPTYFLLRRHAKEMLLLQFTNVKLIFLKNPHPNLASV